jgi:hypothetical protein
MEDGVVVESASPRALLQIPNSRFAQLAGSQGLTKDSATESPADTRAVDHT